MILYHLIHYQTTNFRLFQTERVCRRQFQFDQNGRKLSKRVENTVTSNFSFSHSVFKRLVSQGHQKVSLCGNGLTHNDDFGSPWVFPLIVFKSSLLRSLKFVVSFSYHQSIWNLIYHFGLFSLFCQFDLKFPGIRFKAADVMLLEFAPFPTIFAPFPKWLSILLATLNFLSTNALNFC